MSKSPVSPTALRKAGGKPTNQKMAVSGMVKPERRYEVEDAMRTIMRAEELKGDRKLMADVKKHAAAQAAKMAAVCKK